MSINFPKSFKPIKKEDKQVSMPSSFKPVKQKQISGLHRAGGEFLSGLGSYGDVAELLGIQGENRPTTLPGEQARYERESRATPEELISEVDIEEFPSYAKLPTTPEAKKMMGLTEPKNKEERMISKVFGGAGSGMALGGVSGALSSGLGAGVGQTARELGAPEILATGLDLATAIKSGMKPAQLSKEIKKQSGLTARQFEKLEKPTKISPERFSKITQTVENEAKGLLEDLLSKEKTYRLMKEIPDFYKKLDQGFQQVEKIAEQIPQKITGQNVAESFIDKMKQKLRVPVKSGEYERTYQKEARKLLKDLNRGEITVADWVKDYRQNNFNYGKLYEPGKSSLQNQAKKDVLLDFNRSIADNFEKLPEKEFTNLFKFTNNLNSKTKDIETIVDFFDKNLTEKFNYKNLRKVFEKNKISEAIKRTYGPESLKNFEQLAEDLLSQEQGMRLLKSAERSGITLGDAGTYLVSPKLAALKKSGKLFNYARTGLLDRPQIMIDWAEGIKAAKKGSFIKAKDLLSNVHEKLEATNQGPIPKE